MEAKKILFIDDDDLILTGYKRLFSDRFDIDIETNGIKALETIQKYPNMYSVVIVDMQMPIISGIEFLKRLKKYHPDISRLMVTGMTDKTIAIDAVNEGEIFRFFEKPCKEESLFIGIMDGIKQHELIVAEKEILNQTLQGIVSLLVELLSKTHPILFERAKKVVDMIKILSKNNIITNEWELKIAALLYNIGYFAIPDDILKDRDEFRKEAVKDVPKISAKLISKVKRFSNVSKILEGSLNCDDENFCEESKLISLLYTVVMNNEKGIPMYKTLEDENYNNLLFGDKKIIDIVREYIILPNIDNEDDTISINVYSLKEGDIIASEVVGYNDEIIMNTGKLVTTMVIDMLIVFYEDNLISRNILVKR